MHSDSLARTQERMLKAEKRSQHRGPRQGLPTVGQGRRHARAHTHTHRARRQACRKPKMRSQRRCARARARVLTGEHSKRRTASKAEGKSMLDLSVMCKGFAAVACSGDHDCLTILLDRTEATMRQINSSEAAMTVPYRLECDGAPRRVRNMQVTRPTFGASDSGDSMPDRNWRFTVACTSFQRFRFVAIINSAGPLLSQMRLLQKRAIV
jgi:hypothetical protein